MNRFGSVTGAAGILTSGNPLFVGMGTPSQGAAVAAGLPGKRAKTLRGPECSDGFWDPDTLVAGAEFVSCLVAFEMSLAENNDLSEPMGCVFKIQPLGRSL